MESITCVVAVQCFYDEKGIPRPREVGVTEVNEEIGRAVSFHVNWKNICTFDNVDENIRIQQQINGLSFYPDESLNAIIDSTGFRHIVTIVPGDKWKDFFLKLIKELNPTSGTIGYYDTEGVLRDLFDEKDIKFMNINDILLSPKLKKCKLHKVYSPEFKNLQCAFSIAVFLAQYLIDENKKICGMTEDAIRKHNRKEKAKLIVARIFGLPSPFAEDSEYTTRDDIALLKEYLP